MLRYYRGHRAAASQGGGVPEIPYSPGIFSIPGAGTWRISWAGRVSLRAGQGIFRGRAANGAGLSGISLSLLAGCWREPDHMPDQCGDFSVVERRLLSRSPGPRVRPAAGPRINSGQDPLVRIRVRRRADPGFRRGCDERGAGLRAHPAAISSRHGGAAGAEDRGADADMGRAEADRGLEIGAHPHAQRGETVALRDLAQQREMQRRLLVPRAGCTSARRSAIRAGRGSRAMKSSAAAGKMPAFCASSPVLTSM